MDVFKALTVPSHMRPPAAAVNWVELSADPAVNQAMQGQVARALGLINDVLQQLTQTVERHGAAAPGRVRGGGGGCWEVGEFAG